MPHRTAALEQLLAQGRDNALLRFSLGTAYLESNAVLAITHLRCALDFDPTYSAAWKALGRALVNVQDLDGAAQAFGAGIAAATQRGDVQAAKEMTVFLKRLRRPLGPVSD